MILRLLALFLLLFPGHASANEFLEFLMSMDEEGSAVSPATPDAEGHALLDFQGKINGRSAKEFIAKLKSTCSAGAKKITIRLNSEGGDFDSGVLMAQAIERCGMPVECLVDGDAKSMAFYLLQSCSVRRATERSALMAHEPWIPVTYLARAHFAEYKREIEVAAHQYASHCASRMAIPVERFAKMIRGRDWNITAPEALKAGALDEVVPNPNTPACVP